MINICTIFCTNHMRPAILETPIWYGNSLFDITEKYIVIAKYLIKYMIYVWRLHKRIHRVLAAMQPPRKMLKYTA